MSRFNRSKIQVLIILCALFFTAEAFASGGGGGAISPPRPGASDAFAMTRSIKGSVVKIDAEKNLIVVKDAKAKEFTLNLTKKTKFKAENAGDFGGRKNLAAEDIAQNVEVKVMFQELDKNVVEIKVLKKQ